MANFAWVNHGLYLRSVSTAQTILHLNDFYHAISPMLLRLWISPHLRILFLEEIFIIRNKIRSYHSRAALSCLRWEVLTAHDTYLQIDMHVDIQGVWAGTFRHLPL